MKKLLAFLLAVVFVLALSACTPDSMGDTSGGQGQSSTPLNDLSSAFTDSQSGQTTQNTVSGVQSATQLTRDEALDIALKEAGVTKDAIRDLEAELDRDNGVTVWEIDFDSGNMEYSYDINAVTGEITERDREDR